MRFSLAQDCDVISQMHNLFTLIKFSFFLKETIILTKNLTEKPRTKKKYITVLLGPSVVFIEQHAPPTKPST
jgi:hypothetical protein